MLLLDELARYAARLAAAYPQGAGQLSAFLMALNGYARTHTGIAVVLTLASRTDAFASQTQALVRTLTDVRGEDVTPDEAAAMAQSAHAGVLSVVSHDASAVVPVQASGLAQPTRTRHTEDQIANVRNMAPPASSLFQKPQKTITRTCRGPRVTPTDNMDTAAIAQRAGCYAPQPGGYAAYLPANLPPDPPVRIDTDMLGALSRADRALGRLDGATETLPNPDLFVFMYVRKEAATSAADTGPGPGADTDSVRWIGAWSDPSGLPPSRGSKKDDLTTEEMLA